MTDGASDELDRVRELLGREPRGRFEVVVRDDTGDPVVLKNAPLLDDGTPMPTRYWLIGPAEIRRIGQLEAAGGVNAAEAAVDPDELAAAHQRYASERDADLPADHAGPSPFGGVGGTRQGVKCLHAHWAWHLAGGTDPVGTWIERQLFGEGLEIASDTSTLTFGRGVSFQIPWGNENLTDRWLADTDPPAPEALTNALGAVDDFLDDAEREHPEFTSISDLVISGEPARALAQLEQGSADLTGEVPLTRVDAEEVFRLVATETLADRAHNPGLPSGHIRTIVATLCIVLAVVRRLRLGTVRIDIDNAPS